MGDKVKYCVLCEEEIEKARVRVKPDVKFCIKCQEDRERKGLFKRSTIEVHQELKAWEVENIHMTLIKGE